MATRKTVLMHGALAGAMASVLSTVALSSAGRRETGSSTAPVNAVSHWFWGDEAFDHGELDIKHTLVGYLAHHGAATFWSMLYAVACNNRPQLRTPSAVVAGALATSAIANFTDYKLTPRRLMPGYEQHLSKKSLLVAYLCFAAGVAVGTYCLRASYEAEESGRETRSDNESSDYPASL